MSFWDSSSIIVNISYAVNILLVLSLYFTIRQLGLSYKQHKQELNHRAIDMALEQSERFITSFMNDHNEFVKFKKENSAVSVQVTPKMFTEADFIGVGVDKKIALEYYTNFISKHRNELGRILNTMESIAVYFQCGGADKSIGYKAIGFDFVNIFEYLYADIQIGTNYQIKKYLPNSIELYLFWKPFRDEQNKALQSH